MNIIDKYNHIFTHCGLRVLNIPLEIISLFIVYAKIRSHTIAHVQSMAKVVTSNIKGRWPSLPNIKLASLRITSIFCTTAC